MKIRNLSLLLSASMLITSCVSGPTGNEQNAKNQAETSTHPLRREPAQDPAANIQAVATFNRVVNRPSGAQDVRREFTKWISLQAVADETIAKFDTELNAKPDLDLVDSDQYLRLWAIRSLVDEQKELLSDLMVGGAIEASLEAQQGQISRDVRQRFEQVFHTLDRLTVMPNVAHRAAIAPLMDHTLERYQNMELSATPLAAPYLAEVRTRMQRFAFSSLDQELEFRRLNAAAISRFNRTQTTATRALRPEIERRFQAIKASARADRSPQSIGPSSGSGGNINGREFPRGVWSMTYDDGPGGPTAAILDALKTRQMPATFFWLSRLAPNYPSIVQRAMNEGHELANHSHSHANLPTLGESGLDQQILESTRILERTYGQPLRFFRLPYGNGVNKSAIRSRIAQAGLVHVMWNVDSLDWQDRNPESCAARTIRQINAQGRGVILFHDVHTTTIRASSIVMDHLRAQGARVVTVGRAVDAVNRGTTP
jgi:peptidoglycan/xylan/chitin deacetylase (PgdA/CDA1 family)